EVLFNCATLLQMAGANQYRIARYRDAARTLLRLGPVSLEAALNEELWPNLGLGKRLGTKVRELVRDGSMNFYVELKADLPPAVDSLMNIEGVGPKLAIRLHKELGVNSPAELGDAARRGQVIKLKGFGPKRQSAYARIQGPNPPTAPNLVALPRFRDEEELPAAA
ncbi:MAG: helix-hairpin-helix domain-containing protein, partial [Chloroflexia bacterium]